MKTNNRLKLLASALLATSLTATSAFAKVDQATADKLGGTELTATGAQVAGNADGSIPAYTGGLTTPTPMPTPRRSTLRPRSRRRSSTCGPDRPWTA